MSVARQYTIGTEPLNCTGCRRCQLICSLHHDGKFTLEKARIIIAESHHGVDSITFTEDCDLCGLCVRHCMYGALRFGKET